MEKKSPVRITRKRAMSMEELVPLYIKSMKLSAGLNTHRIFAAWDEASGAAGYTLKRFFRDGKLYITLNSSVVRNHLCPSRVPNWWTGSTSYCPGTSFLSRTIPGFPSCVNSF